MLSGPLLLPPLVLAGLLVLSGGSKVRHPEATRSAFGELELPKALTDSPAPRALPWAEILLGVALLLAPPPLAVPVAVLALLLFVAYLLVIARALGFDRPVVCACFGNLGLGEVTQRTLVRNVLLVLLAGLTVWSVTAEASVAARLLEAGTSTWAWVGLVLLAGATLVASFGGAKGGPRTSSSGQAGTPTDDAELDYVRQPFPFAALEDEDGTTVTLHDLASEGAVLLVFLSPTCSSCRPVLERLPGWAGELGPVRVRAVVSQPLAPAVEKAPTLTGLALRDRQGLTARIFRMGTPGAVLLGGDGLLAGGPVQGGAVLDLYEEIRAELAEAGMVTAAARPRGAVTDDR